MFKLYKLYTIIIQLYTHINNVLLEFNCLKINYLKIKNQKFAHF